MKKLRVELCCALAVWATVVVLACSSPAAASPGVRFTMDAPFCSSVFPVHLLIDASEVGYDTLYVHVPGKTHIMTAAFATTAGHHVLGARTNAGYVFPDITVDLAAGQTFTDSLPFYCS